MSQTPFEIYETTSGKNFPGSASNHFFNANRRANPPKENNTRSLNIPARPWDLDLVVPWCFGGFFTCASNHSVSILLFLHSKFLSGDICRFSGYLKSLNMSHGRHNSRKRTFPGRHVPAKTLFRRLTYIMKGPCRNGTRTKTIPFRRFFSQLNVSPTE